MKKIAILPIALMVIGVGFLSGCDTAVLNPEMNEFIGTWKEDYIPSGHVLNGFAALTFFSDGAFTTGGIGGMWEIKDGKLVISFGYGELIYAFDYAFDNYQGYNVLELIDVNGKTARFAK